MQTRIDKDRAIHYSSELNQSIVVYNPWEEDGKWNFSYTVGDGNYIEENEMVMVDGGIEEFDMETEAHDRFVEIDSEYYMAYEKADTQLTTPAN